MKYINSLFFVLLFQFSYSQDKIKVDGISSVVGDFIILDSDIDRVIIDMQSQGLSTAGISKCQLLGKLMEDKLYAHHAVQDSLELSDNEIYDYVDRQIEYFTEQLGGIDKVLEFYKKRDEILIPFNFEKINKILGTNIEENDCLTFLNKLGFLITNNVIHVPSFRNDINSLNDISEEIARAVGYNNIKSKKINIDVKKETQINFNEMKLKKLLINHGFYEVINNPFVGEGSNESVQVDNPLDSNKNYLRTNLKDSLTTNLLFNERRQKDIIKLFEVSDLYSSENKIGKKVIGIIASGRIDKNFKDFSKKIDKKYLEKILRNIKSNDIKIEEISRQSLNSKSKDIITYTEIEIDKIIDVQSTYDDLTIKGIRDIKYEPISEFPSSNRDLSFSIKDFSECKKLEELLINFENKLLKDVFVFDYYRNENVGEIKIGFRFIFQSRDSTITDDEVNKVMNLVISDALKIKTVSIPGLK